MPHTNVGFTIFDRTVKRIARAHALPMPPPLGTPATTPKHTVPLRDQAHPSPRPVGQDLNSVIAHTPVIGLHLTTGYPTLTQRV